MIIRISAAVLALIWVHGLDATKQDVAEASIAAKASTPGVAIRFCIDNEALCKGTLETASINLMAAQPIDPPSGKPGAQTRTEASLPRSTSSFPMPPRRPTR